MIIRIAAVIAASFAVLFAIGPPSGISRTEVYADARATSTPATPQPSVILPTPTDYPAGYPAPVTPTAYDPYPAPPAVVNATPLPTATPVPPAPVYRLLLPVVAYGRIAYAPLRP